MGIPTYETVEVGQPLPPLTLRIRRADLVRYAGVSGDLNPIHWNDRVAAAVGLPGVIAHGMLTMARAARVVSDWVGDPSRIVEYGVRFTRPVVVPDDDAGAELTVTARVAEKLDGERVRVDLAAEAATGKVLGAARAVVRLDPAAPGDRSDPADPVDRSRA